MFNLIGLARVPLTQFLFGTAMLSLNLRSTSCEATRGSLSSQGRGTEKCGKRAKLNTLGGIIGRAVLPLSQNIGHAGSEHLVRVRCGSESDAAYLWAVLASEPGYWALVGTAFGTSIPSLDTELISGLRLPWLDVDMREEIASLVRKAVGAQGKGIELENAAIQEVVAKIREQA